MRIDVPWGTGTTPVEIEQSRIAGVLGANVERAADPRRCCARPSRRPGRSSKRSWRRLPLLCWWWSTTARGPLPRPPCLPNCGRALEEWLRAAGPRAGFRRRHGHASGGAPAGARPHLRGRLGQGARRRIFSHDAKDKDSLVHLGQTTRGTEVWVNRLLAEARSVVLINSVEPHYFAGYTGGRKSLFPGLAGLRDRVGQPQAVDGEGLGASGAQGQPGARGPGGVAWRWASPASRSTPSNWSWTRTTVSASPRPARLEEDFAEAVAVADKQFVLDLEQRYDVVVAVAPHPMDCNFYQTNKAVQSGALAVKHGGVLIVVSECPYRLGREPDPVRHAGRRPTRPPMRSRAPTARSTSWACSRPPASRTSWSGRTSGW